MAEPNLAWMSVSAFVAVLTLLSLLALAIRALTWLFREVPAATIDAPLVAALEAAVRQARPGYGITHVEEITEGTPS
jgi:hypothetical protein